MDHTQILIRYVTIAEKFFNALVTQRKSHSFLNCMLQVRVLSGVPMKTYTGNIKYLKENQIFVFGSNPQGRHGAGTALLALQKFGAKYGVGKGFQGKSYAIATKDLRKDTHPSVSKEDIIYQIKVLYGVATIMPETEFLIAYRGSGTNLNGYTSKEMAEMFACMPAPENIVFEDEFHELVRGYAMCTPT